MKETTVSFDYSDPANPKAIVSEMTEYVRRMLWRFEQVRGIRFTVVVSGGG